MQYRLCGHEYAQLYEANSTDWVALLLLELQRRSEDFPQHIDGPMPHQVETCGPGSKVWHLWVRDDKRVVAIIKECVWPAFILRQPAPSESHVTALSLMQYLEGCCLRWSESPFRLFDLPRELRDRVYEICILKPKKQVTTYSGRNTQLARHVRALSVYVGRRFARKKPVLLQVNRQIRSEAGQMYYGRHEISVFTDKSESSDTDTVDPVGEIDNWSRCMVRDLAVHLRDLCVTIVWGYLREHWVEVHVKYSSTHGVQAWFDGSARRSNKSLGNGSLDGLHVAAVNAKAEAEGHAGEALIRFFTDDPDGFGRACFGPPCGLVSEFDPNEEQQLLFSEGAVDCAGPYVDAGALLPFWWDEL